ncbi:MAG: arginase family protein [Planctomycetes bacterium]|nr:arginase family protein [Planctomycetota bacterium]
MSETPPFLGVQAAEDTAKFHIIPAPAEEGAIVLKGQSAAPVAILAASAYVEPHDEETANIPLEMTPIFTLDCPEEASNAWIQEQAEAAIDAVAVPVILGGDPSVSIAGIRALAKKTVEFTVFHISASANLKEGVDSAGGVMAQALQLPNLKKLVQVGVQNISNGEMDVVFSDENRVETFFACDLAKRDDDGWHEDVIQALSTPVYLSLDLSALDRSAVPSVGLPKPGGIRWWDLLKLLKKVTSRRRIAAFDVVDLIPIEGDMNGDYAVACLINKLMAYMIAGGKMF